MTDESKKTSHAGTAGGSVLTTLGIVFIVLKLTHNIDWSWWWVTMPFWGPVVAAIVFVLLLIAVACIVAIFSGKDEK